MDKKNPVSSTKIAGKVYEPGDYQKNDELSSGLALTHEQFSDSYMEGEIGGVMEDANGKDRPLTES